MKKTDAIRFFGGVPSLARVLGISKSAVYQWPDDVPDTSAYKLQVITAGKLKAVDPRETRNAKRAAA